MRIEALPQAVTGEDGWRVMYAPPVAGMCRTDRRARTMYAPDEMGYTANAIRAHELAHATFSPMQSPAELAPHFSVTPEALTAAEEARINALCTRSGILLDHLTDDTESATARRIAKAQDYRAALLLLATTYETGAYRSVTTMLGKYAPQEWKKPLSAFRKRLKRELSDNYIDRVDAWRFSDEVGEPLPLGFYVSVQVAALIDLMTRQDPTETAEQRDQKAQQAAQAENDKRTRRSMKNYKHLPEFTGEGSTYDDVRLLELDTDLRHSGKLARRRTPSQVGKKPRRMARLLTDPQRRVFDTRRRSNGGVVLIDQSGSMSLTNDEVDSILEAAGGAVVIGYSDMGAGVANVWVIAQNGKRATNYPSAGDGNGVDASAIRYAASRRTKRGEPFLWVTDGRAYSKHAGWNKGEADEIHALTHKHRIHVCETPTDAIRELQRTARGNAPTTKPSEWAEKWWRAYNGQETDND